MDMIRFEHPEYFYVFAIVPVFLLVFWASRYFRKRALRRFGRQDVLNMMMPWVSKHRPWFRFLILLMAFSLLITAAINPQVGSRLEEARREGVDIIVAIDVSRSMLAEDIRPNRLERAKMSVSRLIDRLDGDRIGVVAFAGSAITQVPLTSDHHAARMMLRTLSTNSVQTQGTAIGSAIQRAVMSFPEDDLTNKVLIILSDGENHMDDPVRIATNARQRGLTIHTVGIGTPGGAPIPMYQNGQLTGFFRDNEGNTVVSRYDEATLRQIAIEGGGMFREGRGADLGLADILDEIKQMEKEEFDSLIFADFESRFHYFIALALLALVFEIFVFERKNKWLNKIKLF
jgi:Ca-activated chloride channel homolog